MRLPLRNNLHKTLIPAIFIASLSCYANELPECPKKITVISGAIADTNGWQYSLPSHFIDKNTNLSKISDGTLNSDYKFPEISKINNATNSVTGGLSYDEIEESDIFLSLTWDIESINKHSAAVFVCRFHGDREKESPIRIVYLHKIVPKEFKKCTVTYKLIEYNRIPESQTLECK